METVSNLDIFDAIKQNIYVNVKLLLKNGIDANIQDIYYGSTPLHYACNCCNFDIVKLLLEHGANPNTQNDHWSTPLFIVSRHNNYEIIKLLLEHGANPNIRNIYGSTPLIEASLVNNHDIIMLLIDYGADHTIINLLNDSVFDYKGGDFIKEYLESKEHDILLK